LVLLVVVAAAGDGAAASEAAAQSPAAYPHRVSSSHVELYWSCARPDPSLVRMEGVAANPGSAQPIRRLALELVGVDARGRTLSESTTEATESQLFTAQSTPFALLLRPAGGEARFDLYYSYVYQDNGGSDRLMSRVRATTSFRTAQTNRFLVRDACAEGQHLNR
jgi:hypothetical protein